MVARLGGKSHIVVWQQPIEECVGEPAIVLNTYAGTIELKQGVMEILVTTECVPDLIKALHMARKAHP